MLSQYDYTIEYQNAANHGNANALGQLPARPDIMFQREELVADIDVICSTKTVSMQFKPSDPRVLGKETNRDPVPPLQARYTRGMASNH